MIIDLNDPQAWKVEVTEGGSVEPTYPSYLEMQGADSVSYTHLVLLERLPKTYLSVRLSVTTTRVVYYVLTTRSVTPEASH